MHAIYTTRPRGPQGLTDTTYIPVWEVSVFRFLRWTVYLNVFGWGAYGLIELALKVAHLA